MHGIIHHYSGVNVSFLSLLQGMLEVFCMQCVCVCVFFSRTLLVQLLPIVTNLQRRFSIGHMVVMLCLSYLIR